MTEDVEKLNFSPAKNDRSVNDVLYSQLRKLNILNIAVIFSMNFLGMSQLKYFILAQILLTAFATFLYPLQRAFPFIIALFFFEGQGRIVWEYNPFIRAAFDVVLLIGFVKVLSRKNDILQPGRLPKIFPLLLLMHFFVFIFSLFSPSNYDIVNSILTVKMFIVPFLIFIYFLKDPIDFKSDDFLHAIYLVLILTFLEQGLVIFQSIQKEDLLRSISDYYFKGRGDDFTGIMFRAWGTTYQPAAISAYFALTFPLAFLYTNSEKAFHQRLTKVLALALIPLTIYCLFLMQVRASMIRYILVVIGVLLVLFFKNKNRVKRSFQIFVILGGITTFTVSYFKGVFRQLDALQFQYIFGRFYTILDSEYEMDRLDFARFSEIVYNKLATVPIGLGPGSSFFTFSLRLNDNEFRNIDKWHYENLIVAMVTDFGFGSIFILFIYYSLPFLIMLKAFTLNKDPNQITNTRLCFFLFIGLFVIMIGEWFSYGLPFNPTSFIYWLYIAFALNITTQEKIEERETQEVDLELDSIDIDNFTQ